MTDEAWVLAKLNSFKTPKARALAAAGVIKLRTNGWSWTEIRKNWGK